MQKLPDFVPALSHHLKPLMRDGSQFTCMLFHPRIDGGIPLDSAVESQQVRSHSSLAILAFGNLLTPVEWRSCSITERLHSLKSAHTVDYCFMRI